MSDDQAELAELLPCPFCGNSPGLDNYVIEAVVRCGYCGARVVRLHGTYDDNGIGEAVTAWNTRALATPSANGTGEPVAWRYRDRDTVSGIWNVTTSPNVRQAAADRPNLIEIEPLYTAINLPSPAIAEGPAVTDEMVERAIDANLRAWAEGGSTRDKMRATLEAALSPGAGK